MKFSFHFSIKKNTSFTVRRTRTYICCLPKKCCKKDRVKKSMYKKSNLFYYAQATTDFCVCETIKYVFVYFLGIKKFNEKLV